jgi:hypothetical protein
VVVPPTLRHLSTSYAAPNPAGTAIALATGQLTAIRHPGGGRMNDLGEPGDVMIPVGGYP